MKTVAALEMSNQETSSVFGIQSTSIFYTFLKESVESLKSKITYTRRAQILAKKRCTPIQSYYKSLDSKNNNILLIFYQNITRFIQG